MEPTHPDSAAPAITDAEFAQFQALLRGITGIHLTEFKKTLLVARLTPRLHRHGLLIVGHSENLTGVSDRVRQVRPTVYHVA